MQKKKIDAYIIDTCQITHKGESSAVRRFIPGAMVYAGRRLMETKQWKDHQYETQEEADAFVRNQLANELREMANVGDLPRS